MPWEGLGALALFIVVLTVLIVTRLQVGWLPGLFYAVAGLCGVAGLLFLAWHLFFVAASDLSPANRARLWAAHREGVLSGLGLVAVGVLAGLIGRRL